MAFSVNTNASALAAIRTLNATNRLLETTQARINSGFKVASAKDDASTFAIAQGLRSDIAGFKAISEAIAFGQATANVALSAAEQVSNTLNTIKAKIVAAQADNVDRNAIQNDINALVNQVGAIVDAAQFNGVNLLDGVDSDLRVLSSLNRSDASSAPTAAYIDVAQQNITSTTLGIDGINVTNGTVALFDSDGDLAPAEGEFLALDVDGTVYTFEFVNDLTSALTAAENTAVVIGGSNGETLANLIAALQSKGFSAGYNTAGEIVVSHADGTVTVDAATNATGLESTDVAGGDRAAALATIESAITTVKTSLATLGTSLNQLKTQGDFVKSLTDVLTEGVGTLVDADLAEESANLQAVQTRQQLGIQALAIANQGPSAVLALFR
ncbi:MAG: flagellin [Alphaproteobacteria bacterium]|nr:flagellin [Alphaproteobacteria bacterium]